MKKGYDVPSGYMGLVNGQWMKFASDRDYDEYTSETEEDEDAA